MISIYLNINLNLGRLVKVCIICTVIMFLKDFAFALFKQNQTHKGPDKPSTKQLATLFNLNQSAFNFCNNTITCNRFIPHGAMLRSCSFSGGRQLTQGKNSHQVTALVEKRQVNTDFSAKLLLHRLGKIAAKF